MDDNEKRLVRDRWDAQSKILFQVLGHMYSIPTTLAVLAAALLVVATFNDKLIPLTNLVRILIVLLLFCIPFLLWPFHLMLKDDLDKVTRKMNEILESANIKVDNNYRHGFVSKWFGISSYVAEIIITIVIIIVCWLILKDHVSVTLR